MARGGRYFLAGQPLHVIQRGNNRQPVFFGESDYRRYRDWLTAAAAAYGCAVHAYVLMTNHVHLLVTPERAESLPQTMQSLGRRYVRYVNALQRRTGTLWDPPAGGAFIAGSALPPTVYLRHKRCCDESRPKAIGRTVAPALFGSLAGQTSWLALA